VRDTSPDRGFDSPAEMAWQPEVMAGGLVGLDEASALARRDRHAETALLYGRDGHMREIRRV
jgi:hypothetical protein